MSKQKFDAEEAEKSANYANAIANDAPKAMTLPKDRMIELADQAATETDHYFVVPRNEVDEWHWLKEYSCRFAALIQSQPAEAQGGQEPVAYLFYDDFGKLKLSQITPHERSAFSVYRQPTGPDEECICRGNWRAIVKEWEPLIDKKFINHRGEEFSFFGVVHAYDDYYYGMISKEHGLSLLSCVGSIEGHGFTLAAPSLPGSGE